MNNPRAVWMLLAVILLLPMWGQQRFRIAEYNVENLFDTLHAPGHADEEFTPQSERKWNSRRYWSKQGKISRVIAALGGETPADLVALVEVENDTVISHLIRRTKLWMLGYDYRITHSADPRGVNVALLFQPHRFRPIACHSLRIPPPTNKLTPSRDVLHVAGELTSGDTLDVLVAHLPSRRNAKNGERYRLLTMQRMAAYTDSLMQHRSRPAVIITGDMNAWYPEKPFTEGLRCRLPEPDAQPRQLYLLSSKLQAADGIQGTYKYQGEWNQLDHFIVNGTLLQTSRQAHSLYTRGEWCRIADFRFLLQRERSDYGVKPFRSFLGSYYQGGFSDHLPLVLDLHMH